MTVVDGRNRPIVDLGPDDVVISEGGQPREVLDVRPADYPVAILVDTGRDASADFDQVRHAVARFIGRLGQRPVAIGTLGDPPAMIASFDDDRLQVLARLSALSSTTSTGSMTLEAMTNAVHALGLNGNGFSAIVVVSASQADASRQTPEEMIGSVVESGAIVHVVANRYPSGSSNDPVPAGRPEVHLRLDEMLRALADQTHGQFITIYSADSYAAALDRVSERLASELLVEYLVPPGSKATDVKIGARVPGARPRGLGIRPRE